ncbi:Glucose-6-phosphate isomerase [Abeliophyllum distichum]|uniref:Glucose-6-phosphate isomerase n=1 Tax=Abeliophyllum distichum TaxID=126358 RepID=A0ABD1SFQ3_9LAMI
MNDSGSVDVPNLQNVCSVFTFQLLAIYERIIVVEGLVWGINSFDQWGVESGKSLATQVRKQLHASRKKCEPVEGFNFSTTTMLKRYLEVWKKASFNGHTFVRFNSL